MKKPSRTLLKGSILNNITFVVQIVATLVIIPFTIQQIGDRHYGLWVIVFSLMSYYDFLDFGLSAAVNRYVARAQGGNEGFKQINTIFNTAMVLFIGIGVVVFFITLGIAGFANLFFKVPEEQELFRQLLFILALSFGINFPIRVVKGFFQASLRFDLINGVEIGKILVRTALIYFLLLKGYGIVALAVVTLVVDGLGFAVQLPLLSSLFNHKLDFKPQKYFSKEQLKDLFNFGKYSFMSQISMILRFRIDSLIIAFYWGLGVVAHYSIASRLIVYYRDFVTRSVSVIGPYLSRLEGQSDYKKLESTYLFSLKVSFFLSFLIGGALLFLGESFIRLWMGPDYLDAVLPLRILALGFIITLAQTPSFSILVNTSNHQQLAYVNLIDGVANVILSLILTKYYGLVGIALGTTIPLIFSRGIMLPILVNRFIVKKYQMEVNIFSYTLTCYIKAFVMMAFVCLLLNNFLGASWGNLIMVAVLFFVIYGMASAFILFNSTDRHKFLGSLAFKG